MNIQELKDVGINYDEGLKRFANKTAMYEKYLLRFFNEPTFSQLEESIAKKDYDEAFRQSHTLKGITGNLSLDLMLTPLHELVEALRANKYEDVDEIFGRLQSAYQKAKDVIL